jgi:hypothetical protein
MSNKSPLNHGEGDPEAADRFNTAEREFVNSERGKRKILEGSQVDPKAEADLVKAASAPRPTTPHQARTRNASSYSIRLSTIKCCTAERERTRGQTAGAASAAPAQSENQNVCLVEKLPPVRASHPGGSPESVNRGTGTHLNRYLPD